MGGVYRYLMHVKALPGNKDVLSPAKAALVTGAQGDNGNVVSAYKIMGENGFIAVLEGGIEGALAKLNKSVGESVEVDTKPLRAYENFARSVLEVDESLCARYPDTLPTENRQLFWAHVVIEYKGLTQEQMKSNWKKEADFVLGARKAGQLDIVVYKGVGERTVEAFMSLPDGDAMDDATFSLPLFQTMGDNVSVVCRALSPL